MIEIIEDITLIGTAHVSQKSANLVKETIYRIKPQVVAIELDKGRLKTLLEKHQNESNTKKNSNKKAKRTPFIDRSLIKQVGVFGFLFLKVSGYLQQKIGKVLQIEPGIDMLSGVHCAKELEIPLALADKPILKTISEFKKISFFKKISMIKRIVFSKMSFENRKELALKLQNGELDNEVITQVISQLEEEVPELYDILIHQRNVYMANEILKLKKKGVENIVLIIGAGHLSGILEILKDELPKIIKKHSNDTHINFTLE